MGGSRPSLGGPAGIPNITRPSSRPSTPAIGAKPNLPNLSNRPNIKPPSSNVPSTRPAPSFGQNRPSLPGGNSTPSLPSAGNRPSRPPATNLPGIVGNRPGGINRPSFGNANRPSTLPGGITLPGGGSDVPGIGANRPTPLPGNVDRPGNNRPGIDRPGTDRPGIDRPGIDRPGIDRPGIDRPGNNRPGIDRPGIDRPGIDRPGIDRPGNNRPGIDRPGIDRPGIDRPGIDRPGIDRPGSNRPGIDRPGSNRPEFGDNNNIVNRPIIGGNRPNFGNRPNINIGNDINIGNSIGNRFPNRPNWDIDPGFSRPGWGINGNDWHHNWHNHGIHPHHNWYNGSWHGYWGSSWYAPIVWGGIGWGLGSLTNRWGYNTGYYNPYYSVPTVVQSVPYDYSQPVIVNNYYDASALGSDLPVYQDPPQQQQALSYFDSGLEKFRAGQYLQSLSDFNSALKELPGDAVVHEVRALALFANGDYQSAAAGLNSLLSSAPGMDWTTMSGLYGNPDDYTAQLRKLEQFCRSNPSDASAYFVLAYHYLVTGSKEGAIAALKVVVKNQPKDITAKRMLDAMEPTQNPPVVPPAPTPANLEALPSFETDLVGQWTAQADDTKIELSITEDSRFTWKAVAKDQAPITLTGNLIADADGISLETTEQGTMGGTVESKGPDNWRFVISGAPPTDPGLSFVRSK